MSKCHMFQFDLIEHLLPSEAEVVTYDDLIEDQDKAILAKLAEEA